MGKIISISNQKGGVGKTTTAINLACALGMLNKKVLLIDFDPQANSTQGICDRKKINYNITQVLFDGISIEDAIVHLPKAKIDIIPSYVSLAGADILLLKNENNKESILKEKLFKIKDKYDYVFIDCPPSLGLLSINAMVASNSVLIPIQAEYLALEGVTQLLMSIRMIQQTFNPKLEIEGVLLTMMDLRTNLSIEVQQEVMKYFKSKVYKTYIPRNIKLGEAPSSSKSIFDYEPKSEGSRAYASLAKEFLLRN